LTSAGSPVKVAAGVGVGLSEAAMDSAGEGEAAADEVVDGDTEEDDPVHPAMRAAAPARIVMTPIYRTCTLMVRILLRGREKLESTADQFCRRPSLQPPAAAAD
jgi:hypothetical protein